MSTDASHDWDEFYRGHHRTRPTPIPATACTVHGVLERYRPGVDYLICRSCYHVWPTAVEFRRDMRRLTAVTEPAWMVPAELNNVRACPLCAHDL